MLLVNTPQLYQDLITKDTENANPALHTYLACCYFYLGMFKEAEEEALKNPKGMAYPFFTL